MNGRMNEYTKTIHLQDSVFHCVGRCGGEDESFGVSGSKREWNGTSAELKMIEKSVEEPILNEGFFVEGFDGCSWAREGDYIQIVQCKNYCLNVGHQLCVWRASVSRIFDQLVGQC